MSDETEPKAERRGHYERLHNSLHLEISPVTLRASWDQHEYSKDADNPDGNTIQYAIEGPARADRFPVELGFVGLVGEVERYSGPLNVQIGGGGERAMLWYWPDGDRHFIDGMGELHISINVPNDRLEWLWRQCVERPGSRVLLSASTRLFQMGAEAFFSEVGDRQHLYLPAEAKGDDGHHNEPLTEVSFTVVSGPGLHPVDGDDKDDLLIGAATLAAPSNEPKQRGWSAATWTSQWVIALLVLILIAIIWH
jgi:hypothetical protein